MIQEVFNIKRESQVDAWSYWYRDDYYYCLKKAGKQYTFGLGPDGSSEEEVHLNLNKAHSIGNTVVPGVVLELVSLYKNKIPLKLTLEVLEVSSSTDYKWKGKSPFCTHL